MSIPTGDVPLTPTVLELANGDSLTPVWVNGVGGYTFRAEAGDGTIRFIKHGPRDPEVSMFDEAERLSWAGQYTRVPVVIEVGADHTHEWLVTEGIDGTSAVAPQWIADPETAVRAIGRGLRRLHDALPVSECPWPWDAYSRIGNAESRGIIVPERLRTPPTDDALVVCHGDACAPNTLLDAAGEPIAHVDFGALGIGDRWADIAVASMSTVWNYDPGYEDLLIEAYGLTPDRDRLAYYRELWGAT